MAVIFSGGHIEADFVSVAARAVFSITLSV